MRWLTLCTRRRRLSQSDDESDEETPTERGGTPLSVAPTRVMPRRSAYVIIIVRRTRAMRKADIVHTQRRQIKGSCDQNLGSSSE